MLVAESIHNFKSNKYENFDTQRSRVYYLDTLIVSKMKKLALESGDENYCYKHPFTAQFKKTNDIVEYSKSILKDFFIPHLKVVVDEGRDGSSFVRHHPLAIHYAGRAINRESFDGRVETAIHEVAHAICNVYFSNIKYSSHGSIFVHILRLLLDKYEILSSDTFDQITEKHPDRVSVMNDLFLKHEMISVEEYEDIERNKDYIFQLGSHYKGWRTSSILNQKEKKNYLCIKEENAKQYSLISYDAFPYQIGLNKFDEVDVESLLDTRFYSGIYRPDESGYPITSRNPNYFYPYGFTECWVEKRVRKHSGSVYYVVKKKVYNVFDDRKDALYALKKITYNQKTHEQCDVKKLSSYAKFEEEMSLLKDFIYKLNGNAIIIG